MKKSYFKVVAGIVLALPFFVNAQADVLSHTTSNTSYYVGWANGVTFPLDIRHNGNQPMRFATNNTLRMKLNETVSYSVNGSS